jgi:hypothetical protein
MGGSRNAQGVLAAGALLAFGATLLMPAPADAALVTCQKKNRIKIRVDACKGQEVPVDAAELGVTGPQGEPGEPGPQGSPGVTGVETVSADGNVVITGFGVSSATASCPEGKVVLSGGVEMGFLIGVVNEQSVRTSVPVTTSPQGWYGELQATVNDDWGARVWAVCANVAP